MKNSTAIALALALGLAGCAGSTQREDMRHLYGSPAPPGAGRLVVLLPETRHVNVEGGETVRFRTDGGEFGWHFQVATGIHSFDLNDVAPPGLLQHPIRAYIAPDPRYRGMGGSGYGRGGRR